MESQIHKIHQQLMNKEITCTKLIQDRLDLLKSNTHSMFGGNFIYTSDSRFPSRAPIQVHDRVENNF